MAQRVKINMEMEKKGMPWAGFRVSLQYNLFSALRYAVLENA